MYLRPVGFQAKNKSKQKTIQILLGFFQWDIIILNNENLHCIIYAINNFDISIPKTSLPSLLSLFFSFFLNFFILQTWRSRDMRYHACLSSLSMSIVRIKRVYDKLDLLIFKGNFHKEFQTHTQKFQIKFSFFSNTGLEMID